MAADGYNENEDSIVTATVMLEDGTGVFFKEVLVIPREQLVPPDNGVLGLAQILNVLTKLK